MTFSRHQAARGDTRSGQAPLLGRADFKGDSTRISKGILHAQRDERHRRGVHVAHEPAYGGRKSTLVQLFSKQPRGNCMHTALRRHWPEYLMEAASLGLLMVSLCSVVILLGHPTSPVFQAISNPLLRRQRCSP
jgi:hypothetical protein